jgi:hypothetical protein
MPETKDLKSRQGVTGQHVSEAWAAKRRQAKRSPMTATCPAWLRMKKDRKGFEVIEKHATIVRLIFDEAASGIGTYKIEHRLNAGKVPVIGGRAKVWGKSYIAKILKNRAVLGEFQPHRYIDKKRYPEGDPVPNYFPAIVPKELFDRVQEGLRRRRGRGGRKGGEILRNLFAGLARCHYCGAPMKFENRGDGPKGGSYLVCDRSRRGMGCEKGARWRYEHLEASFLTFVVEVDLASVMSDDSGRRAVLENEIVTRRDRLAELDVERDRTLQLIKKVTSSVDHIARRVNEIEAECVKLNKAIEDKEQELRGLDGFREAVEDTRPLIEKLRRHDGETYKLRSMIASRLRQIVYKISVASLGEAPDMAREYSERQLLDEEYHHRFFGVVFDRSAITVFPSDDDPVQLRTKLDYFAPDVDIGYVEKPELDWY